jgi:hypothetical protein
MYFHSSSFNCKSSKRLISHVNSCVGVTNKNGDKKTHLSLKSEQFKLHLQGNYYIMSVLKQKVTKLTELWNSYSTKTIGHQGLEHFDPIFSSSTSPFESKFTKN